MKKYTSADRRERDHQIVETLINNQPNVNLDKISDYRLVPKSRVVTTRPKEPDHDYEAHIPTDSNDRSYDHKIYNDGFPY